MDGISLTANLLAEFFKISACTIENGFHISMPQQWIQLYLAATMLAQIKLFEAFKSLCCCRR